MESQHGTVEQIVDQLAEPPGDTGDARVDEGSGVATASLFNPSPGGGAGLSRLETSDEAPAASLVGSLSVFTLADVLSMLASTMQTGELQVVGESVDGRVWLDRGDLSDAQVGATTTIGQAVFDLACVTEGWFYFTSGSATSSGQSPVPVATVLTEVGPQVDEWRELQKAVPLEAVVALCPDPPGQDVQIRSDQWRVLTTVGNSGLTVKSVLDMIGEDQVAGLRTLRELDAAGLIELRTPVVPGDDDPAPAYDFSSSNGSTLGTLPPPAPTPPESSGTDETPTVPPPPLAMDPSAASGDKTYGSLAEVAMMPPPIADDPWAHTTKTNGSDDSGAA